MTPCEVIADSSVIDPNTCTVPPAVWTAANLSAMRGSRVRLLIGNTSVYLVPLFRAGAAGMQVFVTDRTLGLRVGNPAQPAELEPVSDSEYRRYLLFGTRDGVLAIVGLVLAVFGILIQAFNALSDAGVAYDIGKPGRAVLAAVGFALQIGGLGLLFWRGVLAGKLP